MRKRLCILGSAALMSVGAAPAAHASAALDPSFGFGGVVAVNFGGSDYGNGVAVQGDGRVVAAGYRTSSGATWYDFIGARLEPAGDALDPGFGIGGGVLTPMSAGAANDFAEDVALGPGGKVVVAGYTIPSGGNTGTLAVARYLSDGSLDPSFGAGGKAIHSLVGDGMFEQFYAVAVQGDGKVLIAGAVRFGTIDDPIQLAVVRLRADGSLDTDFGDQGVAKVLAGTQSQGFHVALAPGGGVVAAGWAVSGGQQVPLVVRLTATGDPDPGFDGDGVRVLPGTWGGLAGGVAVASDGDVVVGLWSNSIYSHDWGVVRLTPAGALDGAFGGGDGAVTSTLTSTDGGVLMEGLAIDSQGRIVAGGSAAANLPAVARYTAAGDPDSLFGPGGVVVDSSSEAQVRAGGFTLDAADRPLLSGIDPGGDMVLERFTAGDPAPPPSDPPPGATAPGGSSGPALSPPVTPPDTTRAVVTVVAKRDIVLGPTIALPVRSDEAAEIVATLELGALEARRAGLARTSRPLVIARARASLGAAGSTKLKLRLTAKVRRRLARRRNTPATLRIRVTDRAGNVTKLVRRVRLRRR